MARTRSISSASTRTARPAGATARQRLRRTAHQATERRCVPSIGKIDALVIGRLRNLSLTRRNGHGPHLGTNKSETIIGTPYDDTIFGLAGDDVLLGFKGDDQLFGRDGDDDLWGGNGDDFLGGGNGKTSRGPSGNGTPLIGGAGADVPSTVGRAADDLARYYRTRPPGSPST